MEGITYASAARELDEILEALRNDEIGIDSLAEKVARASLLLNYCKTTLQQTEQKVEDIIQQMDV